MSMAHRAIRGSLLYAGRKSGHEGAQRGDERFTITVHGDGARLLLRSVATGYMQTRYEPVELEITVGTAR
jgi:hypothetical protein